MSTVFVEYVGLKDRETDRKAGTKLTWIGKGSVHEVPASAWNVLKRYPDMWALVESTPGTGGLADAKPADAKPAASEARPEGGEQAAAPGTPDNWLTLNAADLHAYATERGLKIDKRLKDADRIRAAIEAAQPAG